MILLKKTILSVYAARVNASEIQQLKLPFFSADEVQMLVDSNRYLAKEIEALREEVAILHRLLFSMNMRNKCNKKSPPINFAVLVGL